MEKRIFLDTNIILDKENLKFDNKERYVISFISFLEILSYEKNTYEYVNYLVKNNIEIIKVSNSLLENKENIELQDEILQNYKEEKFIRKIIENKKVLNLKNSLYRRWITSLIYYFKEKIKIILLNKEVGNKLYDWLRERNIGIDFKNHIENKLVEIMSEKTYVLFELQEN